jgi:hypothetical protein
MFALLVLVVVKGIHKLQVLYDIDKSYVNAGMPEKS